MGLGSDGRWIHWVPSFRDSLVVNPYRAVPWAVARLDRGGRFILGLRRPGLLPPPRPHAPRGRSASSRRNSIRDRPFIAGSRKTRAVSEQRRIACIFLLGTLLGAFTFVAEALPLRQPPCAEQPA